MIKGYNDFINENSSTPEDDVSKFIKFLVDNNVPTEDILEFKKDISKIVDGVNESVSGKLDRLKYKYGRWFNDALFKWLINRKKSFYLNAVDKLEIFDLSTLDDVENIFPGLKLDSLYLAGGMDEAPGTGKGWRERLEYEFEVNNPGTPNKDIVEIELYGKTIKPSYIVDSEYLDEFLENPRKMLKMFDKPALLSPVRKEIDRTKDDVFDKTVGKLKDKNYDVDKDMSPFNWVRRTFSRNIEPDDEHLLRIADAVFLGQDAYAGAGTYGELEILSLIRKPLFAWLVNTSNDKPGDFKLWTIPHLSKVARNEKEMIQLVDTIVRYAKS